MNSEKVFNERTSASYTHKTAADFPLDVVEEIVRLYESGIAPGAIGGRFTVSSSVIERVLKTAGVWRGECASRMRVIPLAEAKARLLARHP